MTMRLNVKPGPPPALPPPVLNLAYAAQNPPSLLRPAAQGVVRLLRDHFRAKHSGPRNQKWPARQGWAPRGLWLQFSRATLVQSVTTTGATVAVTHPAIMQRIHGGVITPKRGRFLAIPATAQAYAAGSPREGATPTLTLRRVEGRWALVDLPRQAISIRKQRTRDRVRQLVKAGKSYTGGTVWYWLVRKTNPAADPTAVPTPSMIDKTIDTVILGILARRNPATA
jgi:hypothetical protein